MWAAIAITTYTLTPSFTATGILARPVALAIPYVVLLLWLPFVPVATAASMRKHTKGYFIVAIALSAAICVAQIAFQIVVFTTPALPRCDQLEYLLRHIGMILLYNLEYLDLLWFLPDVVMLLASVVLFVILRALTRPLSQQVVDGADDEAAAAAAGGPHEAASASAAAANEADTTIGSGAGQRSVSAGSALPTGEVLAMRKQFGTLLALVALLLAAAVRPSVPSAVYFLVFLGASTWWACFKELDR